MILSPTKHTYQLYGYVLYEYTSIAIKKSSKDKDINDNNKEDLNTNTNERNYDIDASTTKKMGDLFAKQDKCIEFQYPIGQLTYVIPLVDMILIGPFNEDNDKFSISLSRKDNKQMKVIKRDEDNGKLNDHVKPILSLIFEDRKTALTWRQTLENHMVKSPTDVIVSDMDTKVLIYYLYLLSLTNSSI